MGRSPGEAPVAGKKSFKRVGYHRNNARMRREGSRPPVTGLKVP